MLSALILLLLIAIAPLFFTALAGLKRGFDTLPTSHRRPRKCFPNGQAVSVQRAYRE